MLPELGWTQTELAPDRAGESSHVVEHSGCGFARYYAATNAANTVLPSCRQQSTNTLPSFNTTQTVCELLGFRLATIQQHELRFCYGLESFSHTE